jgi:competence ComEA-like helix-hairpin-helix protein
MKPFREQKNTVKGSSKRVVFWISLATLLIFSGLLLYWLKKPSQTSIQPEVDPLPQDPFIQAYFNQSQAAVYTDPYRDQPRLGDDLEQILVDTITSAESRVDVAVQELRLPKIAQVLAERHQAGVQVRVILENNYNRPWSDFTEAEIQQLSDREKDQYSEFFQLADLNQDGDLSQSEMQQRDALLILLNSKIPLIDDTADGSKGTGLMHHKFVVIDGQTVIVSSANFTMSGIHGDFLQPGSRGNANHVLMINSPQLAAIFTEEFNLLWGDGEGGKTDSLFGLQKTVRGSEALTIGNSQVQVQFSPTSKTQPWEISSNGLINRILNTANQSVNFALFVFSSQDLVNTLESLSQQGVIIRGLIDSSFAYRYYSEGLDMMGIALGNQCKYELDNRPWKQPLSTIGIPNLPPGDKLHHKFGIVDNKTIITGSHNWSEAANTTNDETVLVIQNPVVAAHFQREFDRLYQTASLGIPGWLEKKIATQLEDCNGIIKTNSSLVLTGELININTATQAELETLPGVGPKLAQRIIAARKQQPFLSFADLDQVSGVGEKLLEKLRDRVTF